MASNARIHGPLQNLIILVANCQAFQAWTGVDQDPDPVASAEGRLYIQEPPPLAAADEAQNPTDLTARRPFGVVDWFTPDVGYGGQPQLISRRGMTAFEESGKLMLSFEADSQNPGGGHSAVISAFVDELDEVIDDMLEIAGRDLNGEPMLSVNSIELYVRPHRSLPEKWPTIGDFCKAVLLIGWDGGSGG